MGEPSALEVTILGTHQHTYICVQCTVLNAGKKYFLLNFLNFFTICTGNIHTYIRTNNIFHFSSIRSLQPGWSTLTWSSLNIDAYLHHAYSSLDHFQQVARCIGDINRDEIQPRLSELSQLDILDFDKLEGSAWVSTKWYIQSNLLSKCLKGHTKSVLLI